MVEFHSFACSCPDLPTPFYLHFSKILFSFCSSDWVFFFFPPWLPNHWFNLLLHLSLCLLLQMCYLFQRLNFLLLTGPFMVSMAFFMLLSIFIIITLNFMPDKLFTSISFSSSYGDFFYSFIWILLLVSSYWLPLYVFFLCIR